MAVTCKSIWQVQGGSDLYVNLASLRRLLLVSQSGKFKVAVTCKSIWQVQGGSDLYVNLASLRRLLLVSQSGKF